MSTAGNQTDTFSSISIESDKVVLPPYKSGSVVQSHMLVYRKKGYDFTLFIALLFTVFRAGIY